MPGSPAQRLEAMRNWNPTEHHEPKVYLHGDLSGSPSEAAFAKLKSAPDNGPVRAFVNATTKMANELQLSREESAKWKGGNGADRKSTRLNSSHQIISYAVFCLKKK